MSIVTTIPARIARAGLPAIFTKNACVPGLSSKPSKAPFIKSIPMNRMPKPRMISPTFLTVLVLPNICSPKPIAIAGSAYDVILSSKPDIETSQAVAVVPIFVPIITDIACLRVSSPALTKPTTITVEAELDWIKAVMPAPTRQPTMRFFVIDSRMFLSLLPAAFFSPSDIWIIPNRNRPSPPATPKIISWTILIPYRALRILCVVISGSRLDIYKTRICAVFLPVIAWPVKEVF